MALLVCAVARKIAKEGCPLKYGAEVSFEHRAENWQINKAAQSTTDIFRMPDGVPPVRKCPPASSAASWLFSPHLITSTHIQKLMFLPSLSRFGRRVGCTPSFPPRASGCCAFGGREAQREILIQHSAFATAPIGPTLVGPGGPLTICKFLSFSIPVPAPPAGKVRRQGSGQGTGMRRWACCARKSFADSSDQIFRANVDVRINRAPLSFALASPPSSSASSRALAPFMQSCSILTTSPGLSVGMSIMPVRPTSHSCSPSLRRIILQAALLSFSRRIP